MIAILGGLGAAAVWATALLCSSRSTRMIGPGPVLSWVMLTGLLIVVPWAASTRPPDALGAGSSGWLAVAGLGNVLGLLLVYSALRTGKVGIVAPIVSTEGAIAAVIAVLAGEQIADGAGVALGVIVVGIVLAAVARDPDTGAVPARTWLVALCAVAAAFAFGVSLYATARVSADLSVAWAVLPARVAGVVIVALPLALTSRLRLTRQALPLVLVAGVAEVAGFALFAVGSRHGIGVTAVLASQFAAIAGVAAYFLFRERLTLVQVAGVATIVVGVSVLAGLQA
jgi:drug/metabolite transporter (DMT)-like permease